ncbi:serine hydrolase [Halomonas denitrificans]|nr:serine hydrolase [Halomonas denitrificans]
MSRSITPTRLAVFTAGALLTSAAAVAQDGSSVADDPRVADAVRLWSHWMEYQAGSSRVPAVSFGIVHDQELVASGAYGLANPAEGVEATPDTIYSICSISKLFTSIGLMQQYDAGRVRLDDPVGDHLEWFAHLKDAHPDDEPVTVRRLLTHSSGLPRESDYPYWTDAAYPFPTAEQIRERLRAQETLYPTSTYFQYSNLGLTLVGEIVAEVSGQAYDDYMREHILDPLEMDATYTDIPVELRGGRMAIGHTALDHDGERNEVAPFQTRGIAPAAGYASNVNDLVRFAMWQFRVLDGNDELIEPSSLREMQRVQYIDPDFETTWGLGFSVRKEGNRVFARHGGGCPGFYTEFRIEPKTKLGAIVLTNTIGSDPGGLAAQAFELVGPAIQKAIDAPDEAPERDGSLERFAGIYGTIWGRTAVVPWDDGLAVLGLAGSNPAEGMARLKHVEGTTYARVRDDDSLGETYEFELGPDGRATRFKVHSIYVDRLDR